MSAKPTYEELEQQIKALRREVEKHKRTDSERLSHLSFLKSMDRIDHSIRGADDLDKMMGDVLETVLEIFQCDRVWLMYPCDPEAAFWRVPMECTRPEYPGAFALNQDIPMTVEMVESFKAVLKSKGPLVFHPEHGLPLPDSAKQFAIQSSINSALYPKLGRPWMWGLSQCSHARQWTATEIRIFQEIGRRISDSLGNLLALRNLKESEEKYRHLSEGTFEAVVWHDAGRIIEANEQYYRMFGYKPEELAGKDAIVLTATPDSVKFMKQQISQGSLGPYEVVGKQKDGTEFPMEIRVKNMQYKGKIARMAAIRDLTEHKQAEDALRKSEEKYRGLFHESIAAVYLFDDKKNFLDSNQAGLDLLGYSKEELLSMSIPDVDADPLVVLPAHERLLGGERIINYEHQLKRKDGKIITVLNNSRPITNVNGQVVGMQSTIIDITERKEAEEALQQAHDELEQRVHERTQELELKTKSLEETNTAMKVLLKKRQEDKTDLENNVLTNVNELIAPYLDKIKKTKLDDQQKAFLSIIESNMNEIVSPFSRRLSLKYLKLTPTEIKIANLIKHGYTSKQIAKSMNISSRTVDTHRKNIRTKIGLEQKGANLRSHLLAMH